MTLRAIITIIVLILVLMMVCGILFDFASSTLILYDDNKGLKNIIEYFEAEDENEHSERRSKK